MKWIKQNWIFVLVFILSTFIFFSQHARNDSWDFHSYVLNGEYWFHNGSYFEPLRPPLVSLIMGVLGSVSRNFAEYGYILAASLLFAFGTFRLGRALRLSPSYLYAISCTFYIMTVGLSDGTELLAFGFLSLFISSLVKNEISGHWLGLMILSRYTSISLIPLLFVRKKEVWKDILLAGVLLAPWLVYNYFAYGNFFASIADQYANNIFFRDYIHTPLNWKDFLNVVNILLPFSLFGIVGKIRSGVKGWKKSDLLLLAIAVLTIYGYVNIPIKSSRYLFNLALPLGVWATEGIQQLSGRFGKNAVKCACVGLFIVSFVISSNIIKDDVKNTPVYVNAINDLKEKSLADCSVMSNGWVELAYYGLTAQDFPRKELLNKSLEKGELLVLFPHIGEPDYAKDKEFLNQFPKVSETEKYVILGNGCNPAHKNDEMFVKKLADTIEQMHGYRTEERPCFLLFKNGLLQDFCTFMNPNIKRTKVVII
ncbi:MAG TPA: hypothetical protein VJJ82_05530 [Candidatus Nanoarchaeia archaeon]|nr:hypothetical protein [Candidatus Nanoarchaeia archaeon]